MTIVGARYGRIPSTALNPAFPYLACCTLLYMQPSSTPIVSAGVCLLPRSPGFPLTDAQLSRSFAVTTGHDADSAEWEKLAGVDTLVILMGGRNLPVIVQRLTQLGRPAGTPVGGGQGGWEARVGGSGRCI